MKKNLLVFVCLFSISYSFAQIATPTSTKRKSDLIEQNLKGPVKVCSTYTHETAYENTGYIVDYLTVFEFDKHGYLTGAYVYNDTLKRRIGVAIQLTYDEEGRQTSTSSDTTGNDITRYTYSIDSAHRPVRITKDNKGRISTDIIAANIRLDTVINYDDKRNLLNKIVNSYDKMNHLINSAIYKAGEKTVWAYFYKDGVLQNSALHKYDGNDNLLEYINFNIDGSRKSKEVHTYDKMGNVTMEVDSNQYYIGRTGNPSREPGKEVLTRVYTYNGYDKAGNWLEQTQTANNVIIQVLRRKYEYYQ